MGVEHVRNLLEFNSITRTSGNKLVVVDFYADWCGPCRAIAPLFEQLARQYEGRARFLKVDVDNVQDVAQSCGISAMPTFHFYKNGSRVSEMQGADPGGLQRTIEQFAPSSADVSFGGTGHQLGGSASGGPPKVNWDTPAAKDEISKRREAIAAAAAQRYTSAPKKEESPPVADNTEKQKPAESEASKPKPAATAAASSSDASAEKSNDPRLKVDQGLLQSMLSMGFPQVRAEKALILTGNRSIEPAMDWCFQHSDDPDIDEPLAMVTKDGEAKANLTPEERKKKANEMLIKARKRREEEEKTNEKEREKNRIRSGKEVTEARRKYEENERKLAIEAKRKEKREAALQKKRVKELLEADKAARREKFNRGSKAAAVPTASPAPAAPTTAPKPVTGGVLQLRFSDGSRMTPHFEPTQTLGEVVDAIVSEKSVAKSQVKLATMYPKKVLTEDEYAKSLVELKLLPRGVLNVTI